tara:strand:- start:7651 stop:7869 length:219 start_codon:yes stop_codon:yes gene_type:complete
MSAMREQLEGLITEMINRGIRYEDAHQEFEKRFIIEALNKVNGNLGRASELLGIHRNTLSRKVSSYRLRKKP